MVLGTLNDLTDRSFREAVLVGLASIPFTLVLSWKLVVDETIVAGGTVAGSPVFVAGLIVGYRYSARPIASNRAGTVTGVVASVPLIALYLANAVSTVVSSSLPIAVIGIVLTPVAVLFGIAVMALVGMVGAILGDWLVRLGARIRPRRSRG